MYEKKLGNFSSKERVLRIKEILEEKSYFNFRVHYGNHAGNWSVIVTSEHEEAVKYPQEATDMIVYLLACEV